MPLAESLVIRRVGFVEERAAGGKGLGQGGEVVAEQAPEDSDEVEWGGLELPSAACPGNGFGGRLAADIQKNAGFGGAFCSDGEAFVRDVGQGCVPSALGEPEGVAPGASSDVKSPAWSQVNAGLDEKRIGFDGLRFAREKLGIPATALVGCIEGHLLDVTPVWY
jgi:hypothetical protein